MSSYLWQFKKIITSVEFLFVFSSILICYIFVGESVVKYSRVFLSDFLMTMSENVVALIFPILVCLPVAISYVNEYKSGNVKLLLTKLSTKNYIFQRLLTTFTTGGILTSVPAILYLLRIILSKGIASDSFLESAWQISLYPELYENAPILYAFMSISALFICGAVFSTLGLGIAAIFHKKYLAILIPEIYYIGSALVFWGKFKPLDATTLYVLNNNPQPNLLLSGLYAIGIFLIGATMFAIGVQRNVE